jgi:hypothetical protein
MAHRLTIAEEHIAGTGPAGVHGVLVDPADRTIVHAWLPTIEPSGCGTQLEPWWLAGLLGSKRIVQVDLAPGEVILAAEPEGGGAWRYGEDGPVYGCAVIVGWDRVTDSHRDTTLSLEREAKLAEFVDEAPAEDGEDDQAEDCDASATA